MDRARKSGLNPLVVPVGCLVRDLERRHNPVQDGLDELEDIINLSTWPGYRFYDAAENAQTCNSSNRMIDVCPVVVFGPH
jgi:hypothetical protein